MRLPTRVSKLEDARRDMPVKQDLSHLTEDELRLIAALPIGSDGKAILTHLSPNELDEMERISAKIEAGA